MREEEGMGRKGGRKETSFRGGKDKKIGDGVLELDVCEFDPGHRCEIAV